MKLSPKGPRRIEPGEYLAKIVEAEHIAVPGKKEYVHWTLEIIVGEFKGRTFKHRTMLEGQYQYQLFQFLRVCIPHYNGQEFELNEQLEKHMVVYLEYDKNYNGIELPFIRVRDVKPAVMAGPGGAA